MENPTATTRKPSSRGLLIINADDWGRSRSETDAALHCHQAGRVTSVSAMVFKEDSDRASRLATEHNVDAGLHINFNEPLQADLLSPAIAAAHARIMRFMNSNRYASLLYNPALRTAFQDLFQAQLDEFVRLYGQAPSHFDGHQHRHLCANMRLDRILPEGSKVRRNFTFEPGEKSRLNRAWRSVIDRKLARRHRITDRLFNLCENLSDDRLDRVLGLAREEAVEIETHPVKTSEQSLLLSDAFADRLRGIRLVSYRAF